MGHMGSDAVAANSITTIAKNMLSCLIRGVSGGAGVLIGNLLGAGELDKAKVYGGRLTRMAIVVGMTTGGLLMLISPLIVRFAPLSDTAAEYLQYMLIFCGCNIMAQHDSAGRHLLCWWGFQVRHEGKSWGNVVLFRTVWLLCGICAEMAGHGGVLYREPRRDCEDSCSVFTL